MSRLMNTGQVDPERKRRAKRNALLLGLVAIGVYALFIGITIFGK